MGIEEIHNKLEWTKHHFKLLDEAVQWYIDAENIVFRPKRYNAAHTEAWGFLDSTLPPDALIIISHIFGDLLQSANSCLDYLVAELYRRHNPGEEAKASHKFPIAATPSAFNKEIGNDKLIGIPFEAVAVIEGLQPYKGGADSVQSRLTALRNLTNAHKHRKLHIVALTANPAPSDPGALFEDGGEIYAFAKDMPKAVHFKAEIGPFPITSEGKVHVQGKFAPVVVLEERGFRCEPINYVAETFCQALVETCNRLRPFIE